MALRILTVIVCFCLCIPIAHARNNAIDSLRTKEDVQKFLVTKLEAKDLVTTLGISLVSQIPKIPLYQTVPDTFYVEDPVTRELILSLAPKSPFSVEDVDNKYTQQGISFDVVSALLDKYPWQFHKADIDGNGYTDMLINIDTAGVVVLMDMIDSIQSHIPLDNHDIYAYQFKDFLTLPDGSKALLLQHIPCTNEHNDRMKDMNREITYITGPATDTLFKIITYIDTVNHCCCQQPDTPLKKEIYTYSDTIDMQRYRVTDTTVYIYHTFAKYNSHYKPKTISKIRYRTFSRMNGVGSGTDGIEINKNGHCLLLYSQFDTSYFSATIDSSLLNEIWRIADYICAQPGIEGDNCMTIFTFKCILDVFFEDGTTTTLDYYGMTPALFNYLSKQLSILSQTLDWQPVPDHTPLVWPYAPSSFDKFGKSYCDCYTY